MKKLCPALDYYIDKKECIGCDKINECDGKEYLDEQEKILNIFLLVCGELTFVNTEQAYQCIIERLKR